MAGWFSKLLGGKKPAPKAKAPKISANERRALLIKDAMAHHARGETARTELRKSLKALEDRRTLRDPETLQRLLALAQAQRIMGRLLSGDLRRYAVLAGLRQWSGVERGADAPKTVRSTSVARR